MKRHTIRVGEEEIMGGEVEQGTRAEQRVFVLAESAAV